MTAPPRKSKVFTISMPPEMATAAEMMAKREHRTMSELFREAFRVYHRQRLDALFEETARYAASVNPHGYTEEDVPRLIREVREEMRAEKTANRALEDALATK